MITLVAPAFLRALPHELQPQPEPGILLTAVVPVILRMFFNAVGSAAAARYDAAATAAAGEHV